MYRKPEPGNSKTPILKQYHSQKRRPKVKNLNRENKTIKKLSFSFLILTTIASDD